MKLCHYFSTNLTLKKKSFTNSPPKKDYWYCKHKPHSSIFYQKKSSKKYNNLAINSQKQLCLLSKINSLRKLC